MFILKKASEINSPSDCPFGIVTDIASTASTSVVLPKLFAGCGLAAAFFRLGS